jgi:ethanolamine permease
VCVSLPPSPDGEIVAQSLAPLNNGFSLIFNIDPVVATTLSIPATFATAYGFVFAYSRVMISMARSGLLPALLARTWGPYSTPYVTVIVGSLLGYALVIAVYCQPLIFPYLYNICILSAFMAYVSQAAGYIVMKTRFGSQERSFRSPLGTAGAVFSGAVFLLAFVGGAAFQGDNQAALASFMGMVVLFTIYYYSYAKKRQRFSAEEKTIFYKIHIVMCKYRLLVIISLPPQNHECIYTVAHLSRFECILYFISYSYM